MESFLPRLRLRLRDVQVGPDCLQAMPPSIPMRARAAAATEAAAETAWIPTEELEAIPAETAISHS